LRKVSLGAIYERYIIALVVSALFAALYIATQSHDYTFDAVSYANAIVRFDLHGDRFGLFHPHHLLFNVTSWAIWKLCQLGGYIGGPLKVVETMNSVLGGVGVGLLYLTLRKLLTRSRALPVMFASGLGVSFGYWICATDGRVNMASNVLLIAAAYVLVSLMQAPTKRRSFALAVFTASAILYHESAGLFFIVGLIGIWLAEYPQGSDVEEKRTRLRLFAIYIITTAALVVIPYLVTGICLLHLSTFADFKNWSARYAVLGWWWDFRVIHNLRMDVYAIRKCMFTEPAGKQGTFHIAHGERRLRAY
jgi:hypothetical protein